MEMLGCADATKLLQQCQRPAFAMGVDKDAGRCADPGLGQQRGTIGKMDDAIARLVQRARQHLACARVIVEDIYFAPGETLLGHHDIQQ